MITSLYMRNGFGAFVPFPPGAEPPSYSGSDLLIQLPTLLRLSGATTYTPWAEQSGTVDWVPFPSPPAKNVVAYPFNDALLAAAKVAMFGQTIPYLGVVTADAFDASEVQEAVDGTGYHHWKTHAVYSQADKQPVPKILFIHWLEIDPLGASASNSLSAAAGALRGTLLYAMQSDYADTAQRSTPPISFKDALAQQRAMPGGGETRPVEPVEPPDAGTTPEPQPSGDDGWSLGAMVLGGLTLGTIAGVVGFSLRGRG